MIYETNDINLTGYLLASGLPLRSHHNDQGRTVFCLDQTDRLLELVDEYYNMTAMINPLRYGSALKILKNIVYQKNHNYNNEHKSITTAGKAN